MLVGINLTTEEFCIRRMSDCYENTVRLNDFFLACSIITNLQSCHAHTACNDLKRRTVKAPADFLIAASTILHDL
ncbi:hypothetical protein D3C77_730900 [compost metagenome]